MARRKLKATEVLAMVADERPSSIHGGHGLDGTNCIERIWRDARVERDPGKAQSGNQRPSVSRNCCRPRMK